MDGSLILKRLGVFPAIDSLGAFQEMAMWHMRGVALVVTLLGASVSQGAEREPLLKMLPARDIAQTHPHKGVGF